MSPSRLPSLAIGNGRMLATLDSNASILSVCWPHIDSPNQIGEVIVKPTDSAYTICKDLTTECEYGYENNSHIAFGLTREGLAIKDLIFDLEDNSVRSDIHVRRVRGPHPGLAIYVAPELDGRPDAQTIYWDQASQAMLAYCRDKWLAIGTHADGVMDYHCGRRGEDSSGVHFWEQPHLPKERIALRRVDALLRITGSVYSTNIYFVYAHSREAVLNTLESVRDLSWNIMKQKVVDRATASISRLEVRGWAPRIDEVLSRSCLVLDVLTNRDTGGIIAGPDVQSGIQSAPGYAAVWGRDAAWTMLGALAMGSTDKVRNMIQFAFNTQAPEGLWLHRHHTDGTLASSWGLHQIDETGIYLHAFACYFYSTNDKSLLEEGWDVILKAGNFLLSVVDPLTSLPIDSVDLWEEREGLHLYTVASVIAGLRAAAYLARYATTEHVRCATTWIATGEKVQAALLRHFWNKELDRFVCSTHSSAALPMLDTDRPDLSANIQDGTFTPKTSIHQYPNWRDGKVLDINYAHDVSILSLVVPFGILAADDPRVVTTVTQLRRHLWNTDVGGLCRYTDDTYGGGNPWPLATLWLAMYEASRQNFEEATALIEWVVNHTTKANLVPEQVHKVDGGPVAAVPLSWSHGMVALAVSAVLKRAVWQFEASDLG